MKLFILIANIFILSGCINIAPDESWDGDDARIWINEASDFNLDSFWFREKSSTLDSTVLDYKQAFEENIVKQIIKSKHFNQLSVYDSFRTVLKKEYSLKGIWILKNKGFQFLQFKNNQYPMTIYVDTINNSIVTHAIK
jgi:hypothetical protein